MENRAMLTENLSQTRSQNVDGHISIDIALEDSFVPEKSSFRMKAAGLLMLLEASPYPMWVYDLGTLRFLAVNSAATRNYLYSREQFASMTVDQISPLEGFSPKVPENGNSPSIQRHRRKDGTTFEAGTTYSDVNFNGRKARLVLAIDSAGQEQAEKTLRETEERYRDLFDHANDIVFTTDLTGKLTSLNGAAERIIGYSLAEAANANVTSILGPQSRELARNMRERKILEGGETTYEVEITAKNGQPVALAVRTSLIFKDGRPFGIRGIARDITDRKRFEERLRQSQKMEALGLLAGGIAHDFNNLLGVMIGYGEILSERLKPDDPLRRHAVEVLKAGQQASALTSQLLAFSRRQVLQPKVLNLTSTITGMQELLRRLIREDIEIAFKMDPNLGHVKADPGQIEQVVMNLAVNARDAMPQGGELTIETENVQVERANPRHDKCITPGHYVLLTVSDSGIGMDEKTRASIFEPFFTTKQPGKGTGLGLATVYGIVKQSCGFISVRSQKGKGSSFMIYLPCVEEPVANFTGGNKPVTVKTGTETILLADDAEPFRKLVRMVLEGAGYNVLEARTASEAAQAGATHDGSIDLLLTDVIMPKVDGYQLSDFLRFLRPEMKVLYMSGYTGSATDGQPEFKANTQVLPKPLSKDALLLAVRRMLDTPKEQNIILLPQNLSERFAHDGCD
jgi:two-component system cell cycle sensor histidine kinase/response regulator CckA